MGLGGRQIIRRQGKEYNALGLSSRHMALDAPPPLESQNCYCLSLLQISSRPFQTVNGLVQRIAFIADALVGALEFSRPIVNKENRMAN